MAKGGVKALCAALVLSGCSAAPTYNPSTTVASGIRPVSAAPQRGPSECDEWLSSAKDVPIVRLYDQVAGLKLAKGEFETTAEFDARAATAFEKVTLLQSLGGRPRVVVTANLPHWSYNADKGVMSLTTLSTYLDSWMWSRTFIVSDKGDLAVHNALFAPVIESEGVAGSYVGSNAFGVARQVTAVRGQEYGVALTDQADKIGAPKAGWAIIPKATGLELRMTPDQARAAKGRIGVRIIGDLVPPGALSGRDSRSATISSPTERSIALSYVTIRTECAALVTGTEVLRRLR